jgi:signal transduction histidine kinase
VIIHEIKNPLGIIRVSSGTLKKRFPRDDSGHELASFIEEEVVRMNHTIAQFLTFARPQNPTLAPFDMAELVHRTTQAAEQELEDDGVRLEVVLERPLEVLGDAAQVQQVLLNLLVNAKQALEGREGGRVTVEVRRRSERGEVVVTDNGPGIERTSRERVFEPFYTTRRGGTGLGLAIARQLLAEQGGRIRLEAADEGARFVVGLPLA